MNAMVRIALEKPYTFIVLALVLLIFGPLAVMRMPTDIFPAINVPAIGVAYQFVGLSPDEIAGRIVALFERNTALNVNDIEHSESQSMTGNGIIKFYFQPGVDLPLAFSQVTAVAQQSLKQMPVGAVPPNILAYNAATVPVVQIAMSSKTLSEEEIGDLAQNFIRPRLSIVRGAATPNAYGGKTRQLQIDLDPAAMQSHGLSAQDVQNAIAAQNQIAPAGFIKIGNFQYNLRLNNAAEGVEALNNLPVKTVGGATILVRDVGHVRDGAAVQTSVVHVDGSRAVLTTVLKTGSYSTLDVVQGIRTLLPKLKDLLPDGFKMYLINDQSVFVKAAIVGVVREGALAAALTSLMILLFLGSWRSTLIIAVSIPLAVLAALIALWAAGQTLNIMTLGGLALAVGILVDDATVTIENINWHLEHGKDVHTAILDGAAQILQPAFVALLCICIVFVPMFALPGVAGYLFQPLALSVVFAMIASFLLSRTLVPTMAMYLLKPHIEDAADVDEADHVLHEAHGNHVFARIQRRFENGFEALREQYRNLLVLAMIRRRLVVIVFMGAVLASFLLYPLLGSDFFPLVDTGQITLHVRTPVGTRIEDTNRIFGGIERQIRAIVPRDELAAIVDNIGIPTSGVNFIYNNTGLITGQDGDIYISLNESHHPSAGYVNRMREILPRLFAGSSFSFPPADIVSQILNFGTPAPIDVQVTAKDTKAAQDYAALLLTQIRKVPGIADPRMQQPRGYPELRFDADRVRIASLGLTEKDITTAVATSVAGTGQSAPNYWLNPKNGVNYPVVSQTPEYSMDTMADLQNIPVTAGAGGSSQILGALGKISRDQGSAVVTHYNIAPTIDLYATTQGRDLGAVAADVEKILARNSAGVPKGGSVTLRGQIVTMHTAFFGLFTGLLFAVVLIYLLIVVNFQSWLDPFVIITALPAAVAGILWMLFATGTTLSVPALTGSIMCMGVATANSILVVSFARERLGVHGDAIRAAVEAGQTRIRPVLMTALAMIIGMIPMALGMGEGGEQNAPLGRAVIGGLFFATVATLMFVPLLFSIVHGRRSRAGSQTPLAQPAKTGEVTGDVYA